MNYPRNMYMYGFLLIKVTEYPYNQRICKRYVKWGETVVLLPINPGSQRATLGSFDSLILRQTNGLKREMKMLETVELQS